MYYYNLIIPRFMKQIQIVQNHKDRLKKANGQFANGNQSDDSQDTQFNMEFLEKIESDLKENPLNTE